MLFDVAVVGAGPAGMTAALYARRAGKSVILFEYENYGGQIAVSPCVENYPGLPAVSGSAFSAALVDQLLALGCENEYARVTAVTQESGGFRIITDSHTAESRALVLAPGVRHRTLGLPGEEAAVGRGISYCAVCDGAFFQGGEVAVVGGGNSALEDALFLSGLCTRVHLIHRRGAFRAEAALVDRVSAASNIVPIYDTVVQAADFGASPDSPSLRGVVLSHLPTGAETHLPLDGLFVAVGRIPQNEPFAALVALDPAGYICAGEDCVTSVPGVFAAGDCRTKAVRQLTTAVGDGAVAGLAAVQYADTHR